MATKILGKVRTVPLGELTLWDRNYRIGNVEVIAQSIQRFGFNASLRIRENVVFAGNHSLLALRKLKVDGASPPANITKARSGDWLVPCLDISHLTHDEAMAFAIADNRASDLSANDPLALAELLKELNVGIDGDLVEAAGFSDRDLNKLLKDLQRSVDLGVDTDDEPAPALRRIEELRTAWQTETGQLWQIGPHRLVIGDSTDPQVQAKLRGDHKPILMVTDPPYGVEYDPAWRLESGVNQSAGNVGVVLNDDRVDWSEVFAAWQTPVLYVWHGAKHAHTVASGIVGSGYDIVSQIIWVKPALAISRGDYHWQHEPCWYAVRSGKPHNWQGSRKESTVWEIERGCRENTGHSTEKPLECMARPIRNNTSPGDYVVDPFAGSGTSIVAADSLNRICLASEIDPGYAAVILERMKGLEPVLA